MKLLEKASRYCLNNKIHIVTPSSKIYKLINCKSNKIYNFTNLSRNDILELDYLLNLDIFQFNKFICKVPKKIEKTNYTKYFYK